VTRHLNTIHDSKKPCVHRELIFVQETVAQLQRKWCVHAILPVAPRVKQPIHGNTQNINYSTTEVAFPALT